MPTQTESPGLTLPRNHQKRMLDLMVHGAETASTGENQPDDTVEETATIDNDASAQPLGNISASDPNSPSEPSNTTVKRRSSPNKNKPSLPSAEADTNNPITSNALVVHQETPLAVAHGNAPAHLTKSNAPAPSTRTPTRRKRRNFVNFEEAESEITTITIAGKGVRLTFEADADTVREFNLWIQNTGKKQKNALNWVLKEFVEDVCRPENDNQAKLRLA